MKYFEFEFIEIVNEKVANQGEALYYTSGEQNSDEMKNLAREIIKILLQLSVSYRQQK